MPERHFVNSRLVSRHPLLYGDYLVAKERQRRAPQRAAPDAGPLRRLGNRKDVMARLHGTLALEGAPAQEADNARREPPAAPPVAINVRVRPDTRAVIITGPNTGGKTATIKVAPAACFGREPGMHARLVPCSLAVPLPKDNIMTACVPALSLSSGNAAGLAVLVSPGCPCLSVVYQLCRRWAWRC